MNIIITGATKGIGRAIAERYAREENNVIVCARNGAELEEMKENFKRNYPGSTLQTRVADMSKKDEVSSFARWITGQGIVLDIIVNNAGYFIPGSVYNEEEGTLEKMIAVNLYSAYHFTRALLPSMMNAKRGHIFNICSIASLQAYSNGGAYSISKFALLGFSKNLREEMKPHGIKVTAVIPGATMTASWEGAGIDPAYHFTRALLPSMMNAKRGHIFNICSIASLQAYSNGGAYSISKFALLGFSKNLREEM